MHLRLYNEQTDFTYIGEWITDERTHALWCANLLSYPLSREGLRQYLQEHENERGYVYVNEEDNPVGFFICVLNGQEKSGFLKFIMVDNRSRGKGYGSGMLQQFVKYTYENTSVTTVGLNVFDVNTAARKCYEKAGFTVLQNTPEAFTYQDEMWGRYMMVHNNREYGF